MSEQTSKLVLASSPQDEVFAARLRKDLQAKGYSVATELTADIHELLIAVISPYTADDKKVQSVIVQALDNGQHIIPVQIGIVTLPKLIQHLQVLDFSEGYPLDALVQRIAALSAPGAPRPLKVLTPTVRQANRSTASWLAILAVIWFIIGIIGVGVMGIQMPAEEYNNVDTEVAATINSYLEINMPRSTEDAINFPATLQAAPTVQRPFLIATATALAAPK